MSGADSMSDQQIRDSAADATALPQAHSAGSLLRAAREASGLHVAALAVAMKVPVKKLEALEADRFDLLPDAVFVRALASSVCRSLKIDPVPVLAKLPQSVAPRLSTEDRGINTPFHTPGNGKRLTLPDVMTKPAFLVVVMLLVGAVSLSFLPERGASDKNPDTTQNSFTPLVPAQPVEPVKGEAVATGLTAIVAPSAIASSAQAMVATVPPADKPLVLEAAQPAAPLVDGVLVFKARSASWVEVTDAKGVVQFRKTLVMGDRVVAPGVPPLSVVVGRADVTDVEVRGVAFPLDSIAKDNVARFEVK